VHKIDDVPLRCVGVGVLQFEHLINAIVTDRLEANEQTKWAREISAEYKILLPSYLQLLATELHSPTWICLTHTF
jgi:hypothetical protein